MKTLTTNKDTYLPVFSEPKWSPRYPISQPTCQVEFAVFLETIVEVTLNTGGGGGKTKEF